MLFYQILCARPFGEMRGKYLLPCVVFFCAQCVLNAAVLVRVSEADSGVTIEAGGSFNFVEPTDIVGFGTSGLFGDMNVTIVFGEEPYNMVAGNLYSLPNFQGPSSLPLEREVFTTVNSGDGFLFSALGFVLLPDSYVFGDPIQSSGTIEGETLSSIGLTPSEITWSWSLGSNSDSLTLLIVPEPSVALLLISAALFLGRRRRV